MKLFQVNCTVKFCQKVKELVIWAYFDLFPPNFHQWYYKVLRVRLLCCYHPNQSTTAQSTLKYLNWFLLNARNKRKLIIINYKVSIAVSIKTFRRVVTHNNATENQNLVMFLFILYVVLFKDRFGSWTKRFWVILTNI